MAETLSLLCIAGVASSLAITFVLLTRSHFRRLFGASLAYAAWFTVPVAVAATLLPAGGTQNNSLPAGSFIFDNATQLIASVTASSGGVSEMLFWTWVCGMLLSVIALARMQLRFVRSLGPIEMRDGLAYATSAAVSPAVLGLLRPRIVVPADFDVRYTAEERALILSHERMHIRRGDLITNALWSAIRCLLWFNPLLHWVTHWFRFDQELACDATTLRDPSRSRKVYATAMLKTLAPEALAPLSSSWCGKHPLQQRLHGLRNPRVSSRRRSCGHALLAVLLSSLAYTAWAAQPLAAYRAAMASKAHPVGAMCPLEAKRQLPVHASPAPQAAPRTP